MLAGPALSSMAWRNLWRNRRRTIITVSSLAFGVMTAVVFTGLTDQSLGDAIDTAARMSNGHVTIQERDYRDSPSIEEALWIMARSYDKLGLPQLRDDAERVLRQNYPDSDFLRGGLRERSKPWWQVW